jgi:hypothetical protein
MHGATRLQNHLIQRHHMHEIIIRETPQNLHR